MLRLFIHASLFACLLAGTYGALTISNSTFAGVNSCPVVRGVHVCYIVLTGYILMLLTAQPRNNKLTSVIFYLSWLWVFGFATFGTLGEVYTGSICPRSQKGVPLCFYSFVLITAIMILYQYSRFLNGRHKA